MYTTDIYCAFCGSIATVEIDCQRVVSAVCECNEAANVVCPDVAYATAHDVERLELREIT